MAEPLKNKKLNMRQLLQDLADDVSDDYTDEERMLAREKIVELECQDFCNRLKRKGKM